MRYKVYLKPFDDAGEYLPDFIDITKDVISISDISIKIDSSEFDVGVVRNSGVNIVLRNDQGLYSDPQNILSVFRTKRKNSIVKITWDKADKDLVCGFFTCGEDILGYEQVIFEGVLNEINSTIDIQKQQIQFNILGYESLLDELETPFSDINNGDDISEVILKLVDQAPFNQLVTVDAPNINVGIDNAIDDKTEMEPNTVGENLKLILLACNSVLYLKDNTLFITARTASADTKFNFYGQGSITGIENVINIPKYRDGLNRTFNYWVWEQTNNISKDPSSISTYGVFKKEMQIPIITNDTKRLDILDANREEFSFPKPELELISPVTYNTIDLNILDKVSIDYPTIYTPSDSNPLPRYGTAIYGVSRYPYSQSTLTIDSERRFKILGKKLNKRQNTYTFTVREI